MNRTLHGLGKRVPAALARVDLVEHSPVGFPAPDDEGGDGLAAYLPQPAAHDRRQPRATA